MKKSFNTKQSGNRKSYFLFLLVAVAAVSVSAFLQSCQSWREDEDSDEEKIVDTSEFLKKGSEQN